MGIREQAKKMIGGGKEKFSCQQDPQTGKIACRSFREFQDGTRQELAGEDFEATGDCQMIPTSMWENEDGALDRLEKKSIPRIKEKCQAKPSDY